MEGRRRGERYSRDPNTPVLHKEKPRDTAEVNEKRVMFLIILFIVKKRSNKHIK